MLLPLSVGNAHPTQCRLIIDPPAPGAWNMAVDEVLLIDAMENGLTTLRFYEWDAPTLSLGYFQKYDDRSRHPSSIDCQCVRRQTGGGAIVHDRELTYSVAVPAGHPFSRQTETLYSAVHDAFIKSIETMFGDKLVGKLSRHSDQESSEHWREEPFLCFDRRAPGDVVLAFGDGTGNTSGSSLQRDHKILGSAQRRHRGAVMQHGSLLLSASPAAPKLPGLSELINGQMLIGEIVLAVINQLSAILPPIASPTGLSPHLQLKARDLTNRKYGTAAWTKRR